MALEVILDCWFLVSPKSQSQGAALHSSALRPGPGGFCLFLPLLGRESLVKASWELG